jgi:hypothetical protein
MFEKPLTFDPCFRKLGREISRFANHTRKLLRASQKYRLPLLEASAWSEGAAPMAERPANPHAAMKAIEKFARTRREDRTALLGAYFAHHHLRMQAELSRELLRESFNTSPDHRFAVCHRLYSRADQDRRAWISALLELTIQAAAPEISNDDYAAFNVGALTDHEDVDLALVVASTEARDVLSHSFAQVTKTFVRFASKIQLFLTEQFLTPRSCALIEEYEQLLEHPTEHVVSTTQLLGAQHLAGSPRLARSLEERVTSRFYAGQGSPILHEAYLRSVMNELRHHLLPATIPGVLSPKREVYVPAKLVIAAMRVIHGVHEARPPQALALLRDRDPENGDVYRGLADAFVVNEVLRWLTFLYVAHSDELDLTDESVRKASKRVALLMGVGENRLIDTYADIRAQALRSTATLSLAIARHLGRVSTFRKIVQSAESLSGENQNLVLKLLDALESHKGGVFWDEVVELLGIPPTAKRFIGDFERLEEEERMRVARRYVKMMCADSATMIDLLVLVASSSSSTVFFRAMLDVIAEDESCRESFIDRLDTETRSEALYRLARSYPVSSLAALADLIDAPGEGGAERVARALRAVILVEHHSSNWLARLSQRVIGRTPEFLQRLGDPRRLKDLSHELSMRAAREPEAREQIELLGDGFDVASLRAAILAVVEGSPTARDAEYTQAVDQYVRELYKACFREVQSSASEFEGHRVGNGIAIYATGGYGRGEAFGADWDYIAVVDRDDPTLKKFFGKILQRVSVIMARRGLLPHNRFTDHFNAYVVSIPELQEYFARRSDQTFIDEAEVLEARFFLGDPIVARKFKEEVFDRLYRFGRRDFIRDLLQELHNRRSRPPLGLNIKLSPGGLREIHLLWLAIRVYAALPGPLVAELLPQAERALPKHKSDLRFLIAATEELRRARELYRLVVAVDDQLDADLITAIAKDLAPLRAAGVRGDYRAKLVRLMGRVAKRIDRVAASLTEF